MDKDVREHILEGRQNPIYVIGPAPYRIYDGHKRVAAARKLRMKTISAYVCTEGKTQPKKRKHVDRYSVRCRLMDVELVAYAPTPERADKIALMLSAKGWFTDIRVAKAVRDA